MEFRFGQAENHLDGRVSRFSAFAIQLLVLQVVGILHRRSLEHFSEKRAKRKVWLLCSVVGTMADYSILQKSLAYSLTGRLHIKLPALDSVQAGNPLKRWLNSKVVKESRIVREHAILCVLHVPEVAVSPRKNLD